MGQSIFTTHFLRFHQTFYSALWLRVPLKNFNPDKAQLRLLRQNAGFRYEILPLHLTPQKEELYARYRDQVAFDAPSSLEHLLFHEGQHNIYQTMELNIYDGDILIACGIFDLGLASTAGICCFYDPTYKKYSLGKYLMLLKMLFSKEKGYHYFYPGYFVPGYTLFDYKLTLAKGATEYLDITSNSWNIVPDTSFENPLQLMEHKLHELQRALGAHAITNKLRYYDFYDANLMPELHGIGFLDFPIFLSCYGQESDLGPYPMVVYDVRDHQYKLLQCRSVFKPLVDESTEQRYGTTLLKVEEQLASGEYTHVMAALIQMKERSDFI